MIDVMQDNIGRVMDRGDRLDELEDKSGWWLFNPSYAVATFVQSTKTQRFLKTI